MFLHVFASHPCLGMTFNFHRPKDDANTIYSLWGKVTTRASDVFEPWRAHCLLDGAAVRAEARKDLEVIGRHPRIFDERNCPGLFVGDCRCIN